MELWKRLAEIYISESSRDEILSELDSLYKEVSSSNFEREEKKRVKNTIKKIIKSDNVSRSLEHYFSREHAHFLLNREFH